MLQNGTAVATVSVSSTDTIANFLSKLNSNGITSTITSDGTITINNSNGKYVKGTLADNLGITCNESTTTVVNGKTTTSTEAISVTTTISKTVAMEQTSCGLNDEQITVTSTKSIPSKNTTLHDLFTNKGGENDIGRYTVYVYDRSNNIIGTTGVNQNSTINDFVGLLKGYGVDVDYNENTGQFSISNTGYRFGVKDSSGNVNQSAINYFKKIGFYVSNQGAFGYTSSDLSIYHYTTQTITTTATGNTKLTEYGMMGSGVNYYVTLSNNKTITFTDEATTTIGDILKAFNENKITAHLNHDGQIVIGSSRDRVYITGINEEVQDCSLMF